MPADEARTMLQQLQDRMASSGIEVRHRDLLIRLRSMIEEDLEATESPGVMGSVVRDDHPGRNPLDGPGASCEEEGSRGLR